MTISTATAAATTQPESRVHSRSGLGQVMLVIASLSLAGTGCVMSGTYADLEEQHAATEQVLAEKEQELSAAQRELNALQSEKDALAASLEETQLTYGALVNELKTEVADGQIFVEHARDGIRVRLTNDVLFESGSAAVDEEGREVLQRVSEQLMSGDFRIEVQGYTDSTPIGPALAKRYPSNWELAAARASEVVRLLQEDGVQADRLSSVSFGETRALAANDTEEGRASNRRIEIRLVPLEQSLDDLPAIAAPGD
jgi:chemotaxis protein MotB